MTRVVLTRLENIGQNIVFSKRVSHGFLFVWQFAKAMDAFAKAMQAGGPKERLETLKSTAYLILDEGHNWTVQVLCFVQCYSTGCVGG